MKVTTRRLEPSNAQAYRHIRQCALKDVPQFVGPLAEQEATGSLSELQARMERCDEEGIYRFGSFLDGQCIGVAALSRKSNPKYAHKVFFWGLYILPEHRKHGAGRQLVEQRIVFARNLSGVRFATLQVTTTNVPGRHLHESFGFKSCGIEPQALQLDGVFYDFEMMQLDLREHE